MEVNKINNIGHSLFNRPKEKEGKGSAAVEGRSLPMPTSAHYAHISFQGGKSVEDLEKTIEDLKKYDEISQGKPDYKPVFPPGVYELAKEVAEAGNPESKTLIDIHKEVYEDLEFVDNVEELRAFFPEFKDVKSFGEVIKETNKGSFISEVSEGNIPYFKNPENLPLELVKLVYGQGISLNDLKEEHTNGKSAYGSLVKFNIPTLHRYYAQMLQLSIPEKNERITSLMAERLIGKTSWSGQSEEGEPYIPIPKKGKPHSEETKKKISEKLKEYYAKNPERTFNPTPRQRDYYEQDPVMNELRSLAAQGAWDNCSSIKIKMSKHFKKAGETLDAKNINLSDLSEKQSVLMKEFWDKNPWAKKLWGEKLHEAWGTVREKYEINHSVVTIPPTLAFYISKWAKEKGIDYPIVFNSKHYSDDNQTRDERSHEIITQYYDENPKMQDVIGTAAQLTLYKLTRESGITNKLNAQEKKLALEIQKIIDKEIITEPDKTGKRELKQMNTSVLIQYYAGVQATLIMSNSHRIKDLLDKSFEENFIKTLKMYKEADKKPNSSTSFFPSKILQDIKIFAQMSGYKKELNFDGNTALQSRKGYFDDKETDEIAARLLTKDQKIMSYAMMANVVTLINIPQKLESYDDMGSPRYVKVYEDICAIADATKIFSKTQNGSENFIPNLSKLIEKFVKVCRDNNCPELIDFFDKCRNEAYEQTKSK